MVKKLVLIDYIRQVVWHEWTRNEFRQE